MVMYLFSLVVLVIIVTVLVAVVKVIHAAYKKGRQQEAIAVFDSLQVQSLFDCYRAEKVALNEISDHKAKKEKLEQMSLLINIAWGISQPRRVARLLLKSLKEAVAAEKLYCDYELKVVRFQ